MDTTTLYWDDIEPGRVLAYGARTVSREEIMRFAHEFDPQPFHVDPAAAARSPFHGLIASGWHTAALVQRMLVDNLLAHSSCVGSPGLKALRWLRPVRPGDTLSVRQEILRKTRHPHRPEVGFVDTRIDVENQHAEIVMDMEFSALFRLRSTPGASAVA